MPRTVKAQPGTQAGLVLGLHGGVLTIAGPLTLQGFAGGEPPAPKQKPSTINLAEVTALDTAGALWLLGLSTATKARLEGLSDTHRQIFQKVKSAMGNEWQKPDTSHLKQGFLEKVGRAGVGVAHDLYEVLSLLGEVSIAFAQIAVGKRRFRWNSFIRHVREAGLMALPIVMLISFLMSIVLAYQGVSQLSTFGAQRYAINLVAISILREMGGLLAAIMVAGRSGSSFTSEIGVMKIREEVDAMRAVGLNPLDVMVLPRIAALVIVLPLLTVAAFAAGILGGAILSVTILGVDLSTYLELFAGAVSSSTHWVGLVKAPVFALFIGVISCLCGLRVSGSADSVGKQTTRAVVQGIFAVLVIDAAFSIFFAQIGW